MEDKRSSSEIEMAVTTKKDWLNQLKLSLESDEKYESFLNDFSTCQSDLERIQKLYEMPDVQAILKFEKKIVGKDAEKSAHCREQGNKLFQKKSFWKALEMYNRSMMLAPTSGEMCTLALALANRSAVLYHMKQYRHCLYDIQAALENGYPDNLRYKLLDRQGKCLYKLGRKEQAQQSFQDGKTVLQQMTDLDQNKNNNLRNDFDKQIWQCEKAKLVAVKNHEDEITLHSPVPKIVGLINRRVPVMSDALNIGSTEIAGRGLFAERDIEIGEVLIVEKPYISTNLSNFKGVYCHHCCLRVLSPVPCQCCGEVVFCDQNCRLAAWDSYHKYECDILQNVYEADIGLGHLALKTVLKAGRDFLLSNFEENCAGDELKLGFSENDVYDSTDYRTVYNLVNHSDKRNMEDLLKYSLEALYLLKCLEATDFFKNTDSCIVYSISDKCTIGSNILRNLMMLPCNAHECSELAVKQATLPESVTVEIGSAIYPLLSLINHSCDPNIVRHSYGNVCVVRAIRGIAKGTQLFDNYGALCALTSTIARRDKLAPQYFFTCNCLACIDDYPKYLDLPTDVPVFKCDHCSGPVFVPLQSHPSDVPCSFCKLSHDLSQRLATLSKSDESYRHAMFNVLTSSCENIDQNITTLEHHLQLMDRLLCRPWRDYNDCQEALKQCYAYKASHFLVS